LRKHGFGDLDFEGRGRQAAFLQGDIEAVQKSGIQQLHDRHVECDPWKSQIQKRTGVAASLP
jgi:hypothetical protein